MRPRGATHPQPTREKKKTNSPQPTAHSPQPSRSRGDKFQFLMGVRSRPPSPVHGAQRRSKQRAHPHSDSQDTPFSISIVTTTASHRIATQRFASPPCPTNPSPTLSRLRPSTPGSPTRTRPSTGTSRLCLSLFPSRTRLTLVPPPSRWQLAKVCLIQLDSVRTAPSSRFYSPDPCFLRLETATSTTSDALTPRERTLFPASSSPVPTTRSAPVSPDPLSYLPDTFAYRNCLYCFTSFATLPFTDEWVSTDPRLHSPRPRS